MSEMVSLITGVSMVCSTICSSADQRKHQNSASLAFLRGIHRWPVNSPHEAPVARKMFQFNDVTMIKNNISLFSTEVDYWGMDFDEIPRMCCRFPEWRGHFKEGLYQAEMHATPVRLGMLSMLAQIRAYRRTLCHGCICGFVHHALYFNKYVIHGHRPLWNEWPAYIYTKDRELRKYFSFNACITTKGTLITRFMGPTWGPLGADRT